MIVYEETQSKIETIFDEKEVLKLKEIYDFVQNDKEFNLTNTPGINPHLTKEVKPGLSSWGVFINPTLYETVYQFERYEDSISDLVECFPRCLIESFEKDIKDQRGWHIVMENEDDGDCDYDAYCVYGESFETFLEWCENNYTGFLREQS